MNDNKKRNETNHEHNWIPCTFTEMLIDEEGKVTVERTNGNSANAVHASTKSGDAHYELQDDSEPGNEGFI